MAVRVTQTFLENVTAREPTGIRVTQTYLEQVVANSFNSFVRVTQTYIEYIRSVEPFDPGADFEWPFDELKPRDIGIYPVGAPIGGGVSLTNREPTINSGNGYWRIVLGAIPVKTRENIRRWRALEANLEGRGRTIAVPFYDGKRAPWPGAPGGEIDAHCLSDVPVGSTTIHIVPTNADEILAGMHFSAGHRGYRIIGMNAESAVLTCTIWPKTREPIAAGTPLEFRRPVCMMRLARDDGMALPLEGHKRAWPTVEFVEAL